MDLSMRAGSLDACEKIGKFQKDARRAAGFVAATPTIGLMLWRRGEGEREGKVGRDGREGRKKEGKGRNCGRDWWMGKG